MILAPPLPFEADGIPVRFDPRSPDFARAVGLWPLKSIVLGPPWLALPYGQQQAVLMHEVAHCRRLHMEIRYLLLLFCWLPWVRGMAERQELAADAFAVQSGFGLDLLAFVTRFHIGDEVFYPPRWKRIAHLQRLIGGLHHVIA